MRLLKHQEGWHMAKLRIGTVEMVWWLLEYDGQRRGDEEEG